MPSHVIRRFRYDSKKSRLEVVFVSGRRYSYHDVPQATAEAMQNAFAKGVFFNTHIKPYFHCTPLEGDNDMKVRGVLFDIDGTLVDSNEFHVKAWDRAFRAAGHELSSSVIRPQIGKGADMLIPTLLPKSDEDTRKKITEYHDKVFRQEYLPQVRPFDHASELVRAVAAEGCAVLLASSANQSEVDHYIKLLDIKSSLTGTTSADDVNHSKPAGDIFAVALKKLGSPSPETVLTIGDTPHDVAAASKCGIRTIAVLSGGFPEQELREAGALAIYKDAGDVLSNLKDLSIAAHQSR